VSDPAVELVNSTVRVLSMLLRYRYRSQPSASPEGNVHRIHGLQPKDRERLLRL
jgi:hypothetical protein